MAEAFSQKNTLLAKRGYRNGRRGRDMSDHKAIGRRTWKGRLHIRDIELEITHDSTFGKSSARTDSRE